MDLISNGKKSMPHILECALEYLREDMSRSFDDFERFFVEWLKMIREKKNQVAQEAEAAEEAETAKE